MAPAKPQRVAPILSGDEMRYRRRYRAIKDLVHELSDESNLLALRVHQIQRRIYDHYMAVHGRPPPPVRVPQGASWAPLVQNADTYPADTGKPPPTAKDQQRSTAPPSDRASSAPPSDAPMRDDDMVDVDDY